jgi:hypothetical protein
LGDESLSRQRSQHLDEANPGLAELVGDDGGRRDFAERAERRLHCSSVTLDQMPT